MSKKLKQFPLTSKDNCIIYLQHLIISAHKEISLLRRYKNELNEYVDNEIIKKDIKKVKPDIYYDFNSKISGVNDILLNLVGDNTKSAISYNKFRTYIDNKKNDFVNLPQLSEEILRDLKDINTLRNWSLHIPESLLVAELELTEEHEKKTGLKKIYDGIIRIPHFTMYDAKWIISLSEQINENYLRYSRVNQQMKKDLSKLMGKSIVVNIKNYECRELEDLSIPKRSFEIQTRKRK